MGVFSEMDMELREQAEMQEQNTINPFTLGENMGASAAMETMAKNAANPFTLGENESVSAAPVTVEAFDDDAIQQAEADTAQAALSILNGAEPATEAETDADTVSETPEDSEDSKEQEDQKKKEHEAQEAQRKAEWEEKQAAKKAAEEQAMQEVQAMTDDGVMDASVKRLGIDAERLTRRNMKMCVTEYVQTLCLDNPEFARRAMHPRKNMINCFKYINRHAMEFMKQEMEDNDEKPMGYAMGGDVPDDLCYKWAEDYFNDPDAEEDKVKEETFVPKLYYGKSSSKKKKEPAKKKETKKPAAQPAPAEQMQLSLGA